LELSNRYHPDTISQEAGLIPAKAVGAFVRGYDAGWRWWEDFDEQPVNPFDEGSDEHVDWSQGFVDAVRDSMPN